MIYYTGPSTRLTLGRWNGCIKGKKSYCHANMTEKDEARQKRRAFSALCIVLKFSVPVFCFRDVQDMTKLKLKANDITVNETINR